MSAPLDRGVFFEVLEKKETWLGSYTSRKNPATCLWKFPPVGSFRSSAFITSYVDLWPNVDTRYWWHSEAFGCGFCKKSRPNYHFIYSTTSIKLTRPIKKQKQTNSPVSKGNFGLQIPWAPNKIWCFYRIQQPWLSQKTAPNRRSRKNRLSSLQLLIEESMDPEVHGESDDRPVVMDV